MGRLDLTVSEGAALMNMPVGPLQRLLEGNDQARALVERGRALGRAQLKRSQFSKAQTDAKTMENVAKQRLGHQPASGGSSVNVNVGGGPPDPETHLDVSKLPKDQRDQLRRMLQMMDDPNRIPANIS